MSVDAYETLREWQEGLAILGGFLLLVLAFLINGRLMRRRDREHRRNEARAIIAALYGEIVVLREKVAQVARLVAEKTTAHAEIGDQFVADEVVEAAPGVGRATVFRTLRLLQDLGIVCQVVLDDGAVAYRLASGGHHHHLVCSECGAVSDFASGDIEGLLDDIAKRTGFRVDAHRLEVYGLCPECRARLG